LPVHSSVRHSGSSCLIHQKLLVRYRYLNYRAEVAVGEIQGAEQNPDEMSPGRVSVSSPASP
ncbi:hypothetical protein NQ317_004154, partial [Molorchus minor]